MRQTIHVLAYLDPGTGSMLLQILLGGVAALGLGGRVLWHRITGRGNKVESPSESESPTPTE